MKQLFLLFIVTLIFSTVKGQSAEHPQQFEYATIYMKVYYQGNIIKYDEKGASRSPLMYLPDGKTYLLIDATDKDNPKKFTDINQVLNFMAKYGWRFKSSNMLPYEGDMGNQSTSNIINTNEYFLTLVFERDFVQTE